MENYGIKINAVTFIFMLKFFLAGELQNSIKRKEMTPISCYKFLLNEMMYSHDS